MVTQPKVRHGWILLAALLGCDGSGGTASPPAEDSAEPKPTATAKRSAAPAKAASAAPAAPLADAKGWAAVFEPSLGMSELLTKGLNGLIGGTKPAAAFAPLKLRVEPDLAEDEKALRATVADKGIASARHDGLELELELGLAGKKVLHLYTVVVTSLDKPRFAAFQREEGRTKWLTWGSMKADAFRGPAAPLGAAGKALLAMARSAECAQAPRVTAADLPATMPERAKKELQRMADRSRTELQETCAALAEVKSDETRIHIDDAAFSTFKADGTYVGGGRQSLLVENGEVVVT